MRLATFALHDPQLAQDVGQEVAIRVVRALGKLQQPERFDGWTYRIAAREIKRAAKKRGRMPLPSFDGTAEQPFDADLHGDLANREWLVEALASLSERQRIAVGLRYVHDLPDEEIAKVLRCRCGTVRSLLSRGLVKMREHAEAVE